jgi:LacI family transcriptional regulator
VATKHQAQASDATISAPPGRPRPTIRDVAAGAGVSLKTVSRVLNDEPGVASATAERVRQAVSRVGFQRDETAANLRRLDRSTQLLGVVTEDVANPFYSQLVRAVEEVARERGYLVMVASSEEDATVEREILRALCTRRVDGLIVVPAGRDDSSLLPATESSTPMVVVDRPALEGRVDTVLAANAEGAARATDHLLRGGHRRIAFLGDDPGIYKAAERRTGHVAALGRAGVEVDPALLRMGLHDTAAATAAVEALLAGPAAPTAILCGNNRLTVGALRALRLVGRRVALVGIDDFELADVLDPAVTVVAQDIHALGRTAAELLFQRLGGDRRPVQTVLLGMELIERGSGELGPGERPPGVASLAGERR